jgi:hypothetical protein
MINYLNILGIWDIIEKGYIPRFDEIIKKLTANSKINKKNNDYAVNIILNLVSESNGSLFIDMFSSYDMWYVLINVYEDNNQVETEVKDSRSEFRDEKE